MDKWRARFYEMAKHVAQWSKDPSTKNGAVIVDTERRIIGTGYNGFPRGVDDTFERLEDRPTKYKMVVHAETNAVLNAIVSPKGGILVCTMYPCSDCAKVIIQAGINVVVTPPANVDREPWKSDAPFSKTMFREASVIVDEIDMELYALRSPPRDF